MSERGLKTRPPELPAVIDDWQRFLKAERTLNDYVEDILRELVSNDQFRRYLDAVYDSDAVEGSLSADNTLAAQMIRERALEEGDINPVSKAKLATISKSLGVVLRRYHASRKERRQMVDGEIVPDANHGGNE